ncbi:ClbS/DfsB family four-helix bundle protein [Tateyamaria armeniaca]|uniref:ClbS/DfsB family four-helix bundle protein n=1 Tax=Tateyamaria armeniaca TaxID=2518930 RepID=A0ABW8UMV5_9RHOB
MAATSKSELLDITRKEFGKLEKLMDSIDADMAMRKRDDDTSIKDVIAHRAHWIDLFLGWYADGLAGKTVFFPAEGYKWNDLKRYNADLRNRQSELDWPQAVALLRANCEKLTEFIETRSEAELYSGPMKGANNAWTPGRWAEAAGPSHFRSASKYLRKCITDAR